ncbi:MAG: hypothetical protein NT169_20035 [Chloroflexi bacterium]|nr:hypothetical protein [Chloroflexota bacterium]
MFHRRFLGGALAVVLVIALLVGGAAAIQRSAWSQGYMMGRLSGAEGGATTPLAPYGYPGMAFGPQHFGGELGVIVTLGLLFLAFLAVGRFFSFRAWAMHGGPGGMSGGPWRHTDGAPGNPHARHWQHRPWCQGWDRPSEAAPAQPEPNAGADSAAAPQ